NVVKKSGANLIVFPELFLFQRDWVQVNTEEAAKISRKALNEFSTACAASKVIVALSLVEKIAKKFHSTLYLLGDDGKVIEKYSKTHLSPLEKEWATQGNSLAVAHTRYGEIGLMLGSEIDFPEVARELSLLGSDSIMLPCDWNYDHEYDWLVKTRTVENHVCIVAANRVDSRANRGSVITPIVSPFASFKENKSVNQIFTRLMEHAVVGELVAPSMDLLSARDKLVTYKTNIIFDRRYEYYKPLVARR
ncbi:MAG: carbon-nitrogen hydrolase family protein, partial [Nitrososphaerota archaeon]|nr:carbon-nitrogen hydrolase family protein [Nitrososphaerota archaeon]